MITLNERLQIFAQALSEQPERFKLEEKRREHSELVLNSLLMNVANELLGTKGGLIRSLLQHRFHVLTEKCGSTP